MKTVEHLLAWLELGILFLSLVLPSVYVKASADFLEFFVPMQDPPISYAYGLWVVILSCVSSLMRNWNGFRQGVGQSGQRFLGLLVIVTGGWMFYEVVFSDQLSTSVDQVVEPYASYAISIVFSYGMGYFMAQEINNFRG